MPLMTPKPGVEVAAPGLPGKNGCWPIQGPAMPSTSGNHHRKLSAATGAFCAGCVVILGGKGTAVNLAEQIEDARHRFVDLPTEVYGVQARKNFI